jgi:hypothetical protein
MVEPFSTFTGMPSTVTLTVLSAGAGCEYARTAGVNVCGE